MRASDRLLPFFVLALAISAVLACGEAPNAASVEGTGLSSDRDALEHRRVAVALSRQGRQREAAAKLEAVAAWFADDPAELTETLNALSDVLFRLGDFAGQEAVLWRALEQAVAVGDRRRAASSWNNLGVSFAARGRPSAALAAYHHCLALRQDLEDRRGVATTQHNLGVQQLMLGRVDEGIEALQQALAARRLLDDPAEIGRNLASLAWGQVLAGQPETALVTYAEAVSMLAQADAVHDLAIALEQRSQLYRALGRFNDARKDLRQSLNLLETRGGAPPLDAAYLDLGLGAVQRAQAQERTPAGERSQITGIQITGAVALLRGAAKTFDALGAQEGRILARLELARALRTQASGGDEAVEHLDTAVDIIEAARSDLQLPAFRATFLGGWQIVYQELVDLLASASVAARQRDRPAEAQALAGRALAVAERAKARALLDRMARAERSPGGAEPAEVTATALQNTLQSTLEALEAQAVFPPQAMRAGRGEREASATEVSDAGDSSSVLRGAPRDADASRAALRRARFALERAEEVSRRAAPPSPAATPASAGAIQQVLDADTVLLAYALAPRRSWLWRLDAQGVAVFPLPPGEQIEAAARNAHQLLPRQHRAGYGLAARAALALLSQQVLDPVAGCLDVGDVVSSKASPVGVERAQDPSVRVERAQDWGANQGARRLVIVPDGALHLVPFGALPMPAGDGATTRGDVPALAVHHEIVHLPSASTLVALRRRAVRPPAQQLLALMVDPVFEADDPRLIGVGSQPAPSETPTGAPSEASNLALAQTRGAFNRRFERLLASAEEGTRIAAIAQHATGVAPPIHRGFDASRERVTRGDLGDFRIVHFATHGVADAEDPALAGLVLSLYNAAGQPRDGLLRARDLYDLHLTADLVVLSACRTALGQEIRGEGLVGLADGFFAAGARHLVVSLWDVDDRATTELMTRFYHHLLIIGRGPAAALRHAQQELRDHTPWQSPAHWAAFIALGDWQVGDFVPAMLGPR